MTSQMMMLMRRMMTMAPIQWIASPGRRRLRWRLMERSISGQSTLFDQYPVASPSSRSFPLPSSFLIVKCQLFVLNFIPSYQSNRGYTLLPQNELSVINFVFYVEGLRMSRCMDMLHRRALQSCFTLTKAIVFWLGSSYTFIFRFSKCNALTSGIPR